MSSPDRITDLTTTTHPALTSIKSSKKSLQLINFPDVKVSRLTFPELDKLIFFQMLSYLIKRLICPESNNPNPIVYQALQFLGRLGLFSSLVITAGLNYDQFLLLDESTTAITLPSRIQRILREFYKNSTPYLLQVLSALNLIATLNLRDYQSDFVSAARRLEPLLPHFDVAIDAAKKVQTENKVRIHSTARSTMHFKLNY